MSKFTVKYGHLEYLPNFVIGELIKNGDIIGRMGSTGKSTANHLHLDLNGGFRGSVWRLSDIELSREHAIQSTYFIDKDLFKTEILITSYYCDPDYLDNTGKLILHPAYDIVPKNRHETNNNYDIFWNRSMPGQILYCGNDVGYGNCVLIGYNS